MSGVDQELVCNGFYRTKRSLMKQEMGGDPRGRERIVRI